MRRPLRSSKLEDRMREGLTTRDKVIDAMYQLVADKGYEKASIGQIADMIGIQKPSIYYYFNSKEDIFIAMINGVIENNISLNTESLKTVKTIEDYKALIHLEGRESINFYKNNLDLCKVAMEIFIQANRLESVRQIQIKFVNDYQNYLTELISYGITLQVFEEDVDVKAKVEHLHVVLQGIESALVYGMPIDVEKAWSMTMEHFFG